MPIEEIKMKWPGRYGIYLRMLREARRTAVTSSEEEKRTGLMSEDEKREMAGWLHMLNALDTYIDTQEKNQEGRLLREKQFTVFKALRDFLEQSDVFNNKGKREGPSGYIKLPTGVGKTMLFIEFLKATGLRSLIAVPTNVLTIQTQERMQEFGDTLDVGVINAYEKAYHKNVPITTYASLIRQLKEGKMHPKDFECLILDEAHKALGEETAQAIQQFSHAIKLGFTATPDYSAHKRLRHLLPHEICRMDVAEAIEGGLLSDCRCMFVRTNVDLSKVKVEGGNYKPSDLEKAVNIQARNMAAVEIYKKMCYRKRFAGELAVAYCVTIRHAETLARLFEENGVPAAAVSGETPPKERGELFEKFGKGEIRILCNADVLIEGFDQPKASVCINLRPTLSAVIAEQRGGRVLRLDPANADKEAYVVDFLDENTNKRYQPIVFPEVLGGTPIVRARAGEGGEEPSNPPIPHIDLDIEGIEVIVDPDEVMKIVHRTQAAAQEAIPRGWMNQEVFLQKTRDIMRDKLKDVRRDFMLPFERIKKLDVTSLENVFPTAPPDASAQYPNKAGRVEAYYAPELLKIIESDLQEIPSWVKKPDLLKKFGVDIIVFDAVVNDLLKDYQEMIIRTEWFEHVMQSSSRRSIYIPPRPVPVIKRHPGEDLYMPGMFYFAEDPDYRKGVTAVYSPRLVEMIAPKIEGQKEAARKLREIQQQQIQEQRRHLAEVTRTTPIRQEAQLQGWKNATRFRKDLEREGIQVAKSDIEKIGASLKRDRPAGFLYAANEEGSMVEYYSGEVQEIIKDRLRQKG